MKNCKDYTIYKVDFGVCTETQKNRENRWKKVQEFTQFKINLIDNFSPENFEELVKYTFFSKSVLKMPRIPYVKHWLLSQFEIGMDMIQEKYGCNFECHWGRDYYAVPKTETKLLEFFETNIPKWVTKVKKI